MIQLQQHDNAGALSSFNADRDVARALAAKRPDNVDWQHNLQIACNKVAAALAAQGDRTGALAAYREGLDIVRAIVAKEPDRAAWQRELRISLNAVAGQLSEQGDKPGALAAYLESADIARRLAAAEPANVQAQIDLYAVLYTLTDVADPQHARAALTEALPIIDKLAQENKLGEGQKDWPQMTREALAKLH